ncbi:MAG: hypothetical protein ACYS99_02800, partial [Planctomycetota bacterium]
LLVLGLLLSSPLPPVDRALLWLEKHQREDGSWEGTEDISDQAATGFALLAFLSTGETHKHGKHKATVRKGLRWLCEGQTEDGRLAPPGCVHPLRDHAVASFALAEAYTMTASPLFKRRAMSAVGFLERHRTPKLAWRNLETSAWAVAAIRAFAGARRKEIDDDLVAGVRAFLAKSKRTDLRAVAAGAWIRILIGDDPLRDKAIKKAVKTLLAHLPRWEKDKGADVDLLYWHLGSRVCDRARRAMWAKWRGAVEELLVARQARDGSWEPVGRWGRASGRAAVTGALAVCLSIQYYWCPLLRPK